MSFCVVTLGPSFFPPRGSVPLRGLSIQLADGEGELEGFPLLAHISFRAP